MNSLTPCNKRGRNPLGAYSMTEYHLKSSYGENSDSLRDAVVAGVKEEFEAKLREFVMSKVPSGSLSNVEMIVESLRPQLGVTTKDIEPFR